MKITDASGRSVQATLFRHVPPDNETKRGAGTFNGLNLTVRSATGFVVGNYPDMAELAEAWPELASLLAEQIRAERKS